MFIDFQPNKSEINYMLLYYVIASFYALKMHDVLLL